MANLRRYKFFIFSVILYFLNSSFSLLKIQCRIDFEINGLSNEKIVLVSEYSDKQIIIDTISLDVNGKGYYQSEKRLTSGLYMIVFPDSKYFEILINDEEQFFTVSTDTVNLFNNLYIEGADETQLYQRFQLLSMKNDEIKSKSYTDNFNANEYKSFYETYDNFKDSVCTSIPHSLLCKIIRLNEFPKYKPSGTKPSKSSFYDIQKQNINIFYNNIDFNDSRLTNSRLLYDKFNYFFNILLSQNPDTIIKYIDITIDSCSKNENFKRFALSFLINNYRNPKNKNQDKILIHIAENYYLNGKAPSWVNPKFVELLQEKVNFIKPGMIGSIAPDLILQDINNKEIQISKYYGNLTLLFFWSPDCESCTKEIPKINAMYSKYQNKGFTIIAIYVHADKNIWIEYLQKNRNNWINLYDPTRKSNFIKLYNIKETPEFVLLNKNKEILIRDKTIDKINEYLNNTK